MEIFNHHASSFSGQALQGHRDVVSSSFDLASPPCEFNEVQQMIRKVRKSFRKHAKAFRKQRVSIQC